MVAKAGPIKNYLKFLKNLIKTDIFLQHVLFKNNRLYFVVLFLSIFCFEFIFFLHLNDESNFYFLYFIVFYINVKNSMFFVIKYPGMGGRKWLPTVMPTALPC